MKNKRYWLRFGIIFLIAYVVAVVVAVIVANPYFLTMLCDHSYGYYDCVGYLLMPLVVLGDVNPSRRTKFFLNGLRW